MSKWISVQDRLPMDIKDVLAIAAPESVMRVAYYSHESKRWFSSETNKPAAHGTVTHWMPLPNTPAQDEYESMDALADFRRDREEDFTRRTMD